MNCIKTLFTVMLLCVATLVANAQQVAYGVKGVVVDVENYEPLKGATITIANSQLGTTTNEKGEFYIPLPSNKPAEYLIRASIMGYDGQEITFTLSASDTEFVSFALKNKDAVIEEVVVTRRREKATELALLEERRKSNLMVESIGTQELSRKGVSDARAALTKMAGVSRQEGAKNVFVRGLGDRYNSSSLNGLPLPSEDPLYKNISLDFFSSDVIQSINVNKTFNPTIGGDVAGANVDIFTKEATGNSLEVAVSGGANSQTIGKDNFKRIDGTSWFGSLNGGSKHHINTLSDYSFKNSWVAKPIDNLINSNFKILGNRRFDLGGKTLSLFFTGGMDSKYRFAEGVVGAATTIGQVYQDQTYIRNQYNVSQNAMVNLRYAFDKGMLSFNSLYIHDQVQDFSEFFGHNANEVEGDREFARRQQINDNHISVSQILGKYEFNQNWSADVAVGFNYVVGNEPDRRVNSFLENGGKYRFNTNSAGSNERYFSDMTEKGIVSRAIVSYKLNNEDGLDRKIDFGYNGNITKRDFNATIFNHELLPPYGNDIDATNPDQYFNTGKLGSTFNLVTLRGKNDEFAFLPFYYNGNKNIHAAVANATYQFNADFTAMVGLRFEKVTQDVDFYTNVTQSEIIGPSKIDKSFLLPSVNLKYNLGEAMILRASGSKTYTLPQFIEIAPMRYAGQNNNTEGNSDLIPAETYNADLKWELYPEGGELISFGVFYKHIKNPIGRSTIPSGGNTLTFLNVGGSADVLGAEMEIKKDLIKTATANGENVLSAGLNVSYLHSKQKLENPLAQFTKESDKLEGASPLMVNADLTYKLNLNRVELMPTVVFNYFSDRVFSIGTRGFGNIMEKGVPTLDFNLRGTVNKKIGFSIKAENIINPYRELSMDFSNGAPKLMVERYKRGMDFSAGLSYKF
ncbi:TonB-dependent receptor [Sphingobacterium hotanense]|uniref:TonB-dependent receptor n=1 Tax=Sphingobacterium hotanense TaxID=649196 RepID=A0ABT7NIU8_9SPHI|nr:TonB-dependent receptor [Sphingobacterium hotanense]MDM1047118.1 TonB-dependent receptor [Sphingobacterium hotanense]